MMVHSWDTVLVSVKLKDNKSGKEMFLDPDAYLMNDRWSKHGDMVHQYVQCIYKNILKDLEDPPQYHIKYSKDTKYKIIYDLPSEDHKHTKLEAKSEPIMFQNASIYVDVWCSMNKRFQQRLFDPTIDLLKAEWSPFEKVPWLMPLLTEFSDKRKKMDEIQQYVYSWNNYSEVLFVADFPGNRMHYFPRQ